MSRIDLHPEDLLDRAARGAASFADLSRLKQHLAECTVCRVERGLLVQAALDAAPLPNERALVARLAQDVAARLASPMARRARGKRAVVASALVAVCVAGAAAAATLAMVKRPPSLSAAAPPSISSSPSVLQPAPSAPALERSPEEPSTDTVTPNDPPRVEAAPQPARPAALSAIEPVSASDLFSRANQARRDGQVAEAVRLYRSLQERFAGSHEELVSRVSLGRLLLDRSGDSRGALVQFNSYLASPAGGALREEAMVGRALALGRLGRAAEERVAWRALLDAWPKSTHRKRAQARLVELGGTDGDAHRAVTGSGPGGRAQ